MQSHPKPYMPSVNIFEQLRRSTLLGSAPDSVVRKVAEIVVTTSVEAGETVFEKGERGSAMYIIANGRVRVHDSDLTLCHLSKGSVFGEMAALADDEVRSASVTGDEGATLLRLDREALFALVASEPEVAKAIIQVLCQREKRIIDDVTERTHKVRSLEGELDIGRKIQAGFLPESLPQAPGWEIAAYFHAAREVAGDFYDAFEIPAQGKIALVVGDVCGKGVGAALFMTLFRSLIRATLVSGDLMSWADSYDVKPDSAKGVDSSGSRQALSNTVSLTNNYIARTHGEASMFASLFLGLLDPDSGALLYINCGHEAPVIFNRDGVKQRLEPTGPVVGMFAGADYGIEQARLNLGETLLVFTDGVTEAANRDSEQFTEQRLFSLLGQAVGPTDRLLLDVVDALSNFAGDAAQFDDITLLGVKNTHNGVQDKVTVCR